MLQVKVYTCGTYNNKSICKSDSEIQNALSGATLSYYTINQFVDTTNFTYPFVNGLQEHYLYLSTEKLSKFTTYIRHVNVETDEGLILTLKKKKKGLTVDSYIDSQNREDAKNGYIFGISIQLTNVIDCYKRSYYKLQNLVEDVSAVYGLLMLIGLFIEQYYNESKLSIDIINSFFIIKDENEKNEKANLKKNKIIQSSRVYKNDTTSSNNTKGVISSTRRNSFIKRRRKSENPEEIVIEENKVINCRKRRRSSFITKNKNFVKISTKNNSSNVVDKNYINNDNDNDNDIKQNEITDQKKLEFNFFQKLICLNCCECWRRCGNKKKDYDIFEKGMKYISELLEIKNVLNKICIDNKKYSLEYDELKRKKMKEMSIPILSLDQDDKNIPLSYVGIVTEHEGTEESVDIERN